MSGNILAISTGVANFNSTGGGVTCPDWFFSLSDREFQAFSPYYLGSGTCRTSDDRRLKIVVELINGNVAIHRFVERQSDPDRCYVRSQSDYFHGLGQTVLDVAWDMTLAQIACDQTQIMSTLAIRSTPEFEALIARNGRSLDDETRELQRFVENRCAKVVSSLARSIETARKGLPPQRAPLAVGTANGQLIADSSCSVLIDIPCSQIDLSAWLSGFSDRAFRSCSAAHLAAGASCGAFDGFELLAVEQPGILIVQHYQLLIATPGQCRLFSPNSNVFFHGRQSAVSVLWNLSLATYDPARSLLTSHMFVKSTPALDTCLSHQGLTVGDVRNSQTVVLANHVYDETPRIARELEHFVRAIEGRDLAVAGDEPQLMAC